MDGMTGAVRAALAGRPAPVDSRDAAAEALALGYAGLMDEAAPAGKYRKALAVLSRKIVGTETEDDDPYEAFDMIAQALADHSVASDLGPKLLATLTGLGLTPQARGTSKDRGAAPKPANPMDEIKAARERRMAERDARGA